MINANRDSTGIKMMGRLRKGAYSNRLNHKHRLQNRRYFLIVYGLIFPVVFLLLFNQSMTNPAMAADWKLIPKIGLSGGYDDNIFFTRDDKVDSSVINVAPGLEVDYKTELSSLLFTADYDILSYLDESDLNRVNQRYELDGDHRLGERWDARVGFRFYDDTTLNSYLEETGRVVGRFDRDYLDAKAGLAYNLTTISSIGAGYRYEKARYEDDIFPDFDKHRVNLLYRHLLRTEQDTLSIGPSFYHRTNDINDTDYVSIDVGWDRDWSEITRTFILLGARYTKVEDNVGNDENKWGARARFDLTRQGEASTIIFKYYHDLATLARGVDVNVDNLFLRYDYRLTERFGIGINGRLIFTYDLFDSEDNVNDSRYYLIEPFLRYRIAENFNVYMRYSYQNSSQDIIGNDDTRERNRAWIEFRYEYPMLL